MMVNLSSSKNLPSLEDPKTLERFQRYVEVFRKQNAMTSARTFSRVLLGLLELHPNFAQSHPELFRSYQEVLILSRWIGLSLLPDSEIPEMFEKYLVLGLSLDPDIDLEEKFIEKLIGTIVLPERDQLKREVRKALERNRELLTSKRLVSDAGQRDPTVGNWILDFVAHLADFLLDRVKESEYFVSGTNTKNLSEEERKRVTTLFRFYRRCHLSSLTVEGVEEVLPVDEEDRKGMIRGGQFEEMKRSDYDRLVKELSAIREKISGLTTPAMPEMNGNRQKEKLYEVYLGPSEERKKIAGEEKRLVSMDAASLRGIFRQALEQQDRWKTTAALRRLTEIGDIPSGFFEDSKIRSLFEAFLRDHYPPHLLSNFQASGFTPPYLSVFLQRVFTNVLKIPPQDSARIGIQVESLLVRQGKREYQGMVYGDLSKGEFVWQDVREEGKKLVIVTPP